MTALGPLELFLIIAVAALLFGAPILTFLLGYGMGQRKAQAGEASSAPDNESTGEDEAND